MKSSDFSTIAYQSVAFTSSGFPKLGPLASGLIASFGQHFTADPVTLPVPELPPPDFPRLILRNDHGSRTLQVSQTRIDIVLQTTTAFSSGEGDCLALSILDFLESEFQMRFGRLSLIIFRLFKIESPGIVLATHFCKPNWVETKALNRPQAFEVHAFKEYRVSDEFPRINSWIRHKAGVHLLNGVTPVTGIIVEQDLNTVPDELSVTDFPSERRKRFFNSMAVEADKILLSYYP